MEKEASRGLKIRGVFPGGNFSAPLIIAGTTARRAYRRKRSVYVRSPCPPSSSHQLMGIQLDPVNKGIVSRPLGKGNHNLAIAISRYRELLDRRAFIASRGIDIEIA